MTIDMVISMYPGFHMEGEIRMLNRQANSVTEGVIVSIGSYRGQMDCALALHATVPVFCIDPRTPSDGYPFSDEDRLHWMDNMLLMGVADRVRPINLPSLTVASIWTEPIGLLWIDGDHTKVQADLDAWLPYVIDGGLVCFHDIFDAGVAATIAGCDSLVQIETCDLTAVYRKEGGHFYVPDSSPTAVSKYEDYTYNGVTMEVRTGAYNGADKGAVQEVQTYVLPDTPLRTVIDAGAHIGAFTCWIKHLYPDALVLSIEPEPGNFALLYGNTDGIDGVVVLNSALSYDVTRTHLEVDPINSGGHKLTDNPGSIEVNDLVTLEELMVGNFESVDLLKLDVEGSEMDVLLHADDETLKRILCILGERHFTHEEFLPVINRLEALGFTVTDKPHPTLSVSPWWMMDRGLFTATNNNWTEPEPVKASAPQAKKATRKPVVKRKPGRKAK